MKDQKCKMNTGLPWFMIQKEKKPISIEYNCGLQSVPGVLYKWYHLVLLTVIPGKEYSPYYADKELEALGIQVSQQRSYYE